METDEIVKLTCHRLATKDEAYMGDLATRFQTGGGLLSHPSSAKSATGHSPRVGIQIEEPVSSQHSPQAPATPAHGLARHERSPRPVSPHESDKVEAETMYCTS